MQARNEREKYEAMWGIEGYRKNSPAYRSLNAIQAHLERVGAKSITDYGCGTGRIDAELVRQGYEVTGVDIAHNAPSFDGFTFVCGDFTETGAVDSDFALCVDVMEHIPTDRVASALKVVTSHPHGFMVIALFQERWGKEIGEDLHMTLKPSKWWEAMIVDARASLKGTAQFEAQDQRFCVRW